MAEKKELTKPKFVKVKDLQKERSGFNVYVQVVSAEPRVIDTKEGLKIPMVDCVVADETGSSKAFFKGDAAELIKKGNVLAIRNGLKRFIKDHISLEIDLFGRLTLEKDLKIEADTAEDHNISNAEHKRPERPERRDRRGGPGRRPQGDRPRRDGDRPRRTEGRGDRGDREDRRDRGDRGDRRDRGDREDRRDRGDREDRRGDRGDRRERQNNPRNLNNRQNQEKFDRNRQERPRRNDRDFDRRGPRNDDRREDRRGDREERGDRRDNRDNRPNNRDNRDPRDTRGNRDPRDNRDNRDNRDRRDNRDNRDNRRDDRGDRDTRPRREYAEKREERGDRKAPQFTKLAEIMPADDGISVIVKVISLVKVGGQRPKYRCVIGDSSGIANAFLPSKIDVQEGDSLALFNIRAEVVSEHVEIQLDYNGGRMEQARRPVDRVSEDFNLSAKAWVPIE